MNIALVILHADAARGGAERYTIDLASALAARGHRVSVLAGSFADSVPAAMRVPIAARGLTRTSRYKHFLDELDAHLATANYDIIHAMLPVRRCDVYHPHAGIAADAVGKWNDPFNPRRSMMARVERELLTSARPPIVIALSDYVKAPVRKHYPLPDDRLVKLFNAVDLAKFTPSSKSPGDVVNALIVAQDFERKGLGVLLDAIARVDDPRLRLTVVGRDDPSRYQKQAERLGIAARVSFAGATTDVRSAYAAADVFAMPTRHDPCSLVVLEALAMGLPVISTKFNGACEIMENGVHGFVLDDPNGVDGVAGALRALLDPAARDRMSKACLALRPRLSYEHHLDQLLTIYGQATAGRR